MRINLILIMLLTSFVSCQAQENINKERVLTETRSLLNSYFNSVADSEGKKFQNQILYTLDNKHWADSLIPSQLWLVRNFNIKTKADVIDFETLFSAEDFQHLQYTSKKFSFHNWGEIIEHPILDNANSDGVLLSSPAFDKFFKYAVFYLSSREGGSLLIFKKEEGQWIYFAAGILWSV